MHPEKIIPQLTLVHRFLGVFIMIFAIGFGGFGANGLFNPETFAEFDFHTLSFKIIFLGFGLVFFSGGVFMLFGTRDLIFFEDKVEIRTSIFGRTWSRFVDRSILRDLGPAAVGLPSHTRHHL